MSTHHQDEVSYTTWIATKATKLLRATLDCGCPTSAGQATAGHIWCNRIACLTHADDEHDCSAFGGLIEEGPRESTPISAELPPGVISNSEFLRLLSAANAARDELEQPVHPASPYLTREDITGQPDRVGDALRAEVLRQGLTECEVDGRPWEYRDGAWRQVEALRPADVPPVVVWDRRRSLECAEVGLEHGDCRGDAAHLLSACLCDCHLPKSPWWKRLLPW